MHATETVRPAIVSPRCLALAYPMFAHMKFESALVGLVCIAVGCMNGRASAVTAEVARKCAALTAKAYPPQVPVILPQVSQKERCNPNETIGQWGQHGR
jgi:hypothetical protein